ncbi:hypothetical protein COOONC_22049 [Cooperia oncophora]
MCYKDSSLIFSVIPKETFRNFFLAASVKEMDPVVAHEEPFLSQDDKHTIVMFCRSALSNALIREKIKDPLELRRICGTLIREFKRERAFEGNKLSSCTVDSLSMEMGIYTFLQDLVTSTSNAFDSSTFDE